MSLPTPPVPDLARLRGDTLKAMVASLRDYYEADSAIFNYMSGTRGVRTSYRGFHNLPHLISGCCCEKTAQGRKSNEEIVSLAAPLAFDRDISVFDLPRRQFAFGRNFFSAYRVPFFLVEKGVVKLYYLQPRKGSGLIFDELCMIATIHKRYLLDAEFYGQTIDVEYVDVSALPGTSNRIVRSYSLEDLTLWSEAKLGDRLTLIAEAMEFLAKEGTVQPRKRRPARQATDMPLF